MLGKVIYKTILLIVITIFFFLVIDKPFVIAQTLTSPTYQLIDPSINTGGNALQSTASFKLFETIGDVDAAKFDSATYSLGGGLNNTIVMTAPQITAAQPGGGDPGTICGGVGNIGDPAYGCYDKLKVTLASDGNPTDALYAIEITEASDTNWTNKKYINFATQIRDATLGTNTLSTLATINALTYTVGSLNANTSYKFRSFAIQIANSAVFPSGGTYFDQSPYSATSTVSTKLPGIGLDIDIASNSTTPSSAPYVVTLGALSSSVVTTSSSAEGIWVKISTNANSGLTLSVNDVGNGLTEGAKIIGSADSSFNNTADLSTSIVGFGKVLRTGGNITNQGVGPAGISQTISSNYNNFGTDIVGKLSTGIVTLASTNKPNTLIVSGYDLKARITSTTPSGSYSDTITYTLAGSF